MNVLLQCQEPQGINIDLWRSPTITGRWCVWDRKDHTHIDTLADEKKGFMLIMRQIWHYSHLDVVFISLPLPPTIPPDHNSLCPDKPREREGRDRGGALKKMERWRKREQPTDHIMVVASVIWLMLREREQERERLQFDYCLQPTFHLQDDTIQYIF